ncbi:MAG: D-2-hydroxyacid dehydrogenase [Saprospiraceae bacterium]|nr:D-2-hydroxyacid dehydrogenase [Saprospiraceae bacterium]
MPKIVVLDGYALNPGDLSWSALEAFGEVVVYDRTTPNEILSRASGATMLLVNKCPLNKDSIKQLPELRYIGVTATGYNNIDLIATQAQGITVCNTVGYSTHSVAQHVFALLFALTNRIESHHQSVLQGDWRNCLDFCYTLSPTIELAGKTIGIYGFGKIGQKVADIALAMDMQVLATHKHPERDARPNVQFVSLETLFQESDAITLHAPLSAENHQIVNQFLLRKMKPSAYLINTGRGQLIDEADLKAALEAGVLAGAGLDVLSVEPPKENNMLIGVKNCLITPHIAWATTAARARLMKIVTDNVEAFLSGQPQNVVTH